MGQDLKTCILTSPKGSVEGTRGVEGSMSLLSVCNSVLDSTGRSCGESTRAYSGCLLCGAPATVPHSLDRQYHQTEARPPKVYFLGDRCSWETESERKVGHLGRKRCESAPPRCYNPALLHMIQQKSKHPHHGTIFPRNENASTAGNGAPELVRNEKSRMRGAGWEPRRLQLDPHLSSSIPR